MYKKFGERCMGYQYDTNGILFGFVLASEQAYFIFLASLVFDSIT